MAFQKIKNVRISGISACVPSNIESSNNSPAFLNKIDADQFINTTGIIERRIADSGICSSDLCFHAAEKLINELMWDKKEIDCLIFVTQTPDYIVPATSCILQSRLGLSDACYAFDITLGCSGWVYGVSVMASLLSDGYMKKGLLLVGETTSKTKSKMDKSTYPLFGDAGTATAMEFKKNESPMYFHTGTDGSKFEAIYIPDGGFRKMTTSDSLEMKEYEPGIIKNRLQYFMDGATVFVFSMKTAPRSVSFLLDSIKLNSNEIDYFIFHQANKMIVEKIKEKLKLPVNKVPTSYEFFGNTSMSSIPLTMVIKIREELCNSKLHLIACGFGSGLSWATCYIETDKIICPALIEI